MKNRLLLKLFAFAVIVGLAFTTSCKDYDEDINKVSNDLAALKADLEKKIQDQKTTYDKAIADLQKELATVKEDLKKAITQEKLDQALALYVKLESFNAFKAEAQKALSDLQALVAKAATKEELANLKTLLEGKITEAKNELGLKIGALETLLDLKDGKLGVIEDLKAQLADQLVKINKNADDIKDLQTFLESEYESLQAMDDALRALIDTKVDKTTFDAKVEELNKKIDDAVEALEKKIDAVDKKLDIERLRINTLFDFTRQLKGLTFVPTRGLPAEKTMKLYYFAGDYTAEHVLIYRVTPSNSQYGRDFDIESLNYQITTRSADDGVADGSELVDVRINPEGTYAVPDKAEMQKGIKQFGDLLYVPVHIQSEEPCEVFGNHDWWCNEFYTQCTTCGEWASLWSYNFPEYVVKTVKDPEVDYNCQWYNSGGARNGETQTFTQNRGLSLVITANAKNLDGKEGDPETIRFKSTEHVNTFLVPTQIKLSEAKDGKGNQILDSNLTQRLLKFTLEDATVWANLNENPLPNDNKNWNILAWSGNQGAGGVWTPGEIDLNDYVTSLYYPQDGGDLSRKEVTEDDPHRYLYAEFGKEFGTPYFDKPHYAKPVYKFEQMVYKDTNHDIVIGPKGAEGVTHSYAEINGSILTVFNDGASIQGIRNKKLIIKVTQINSECEERQPVGYLVIKYTDDPMGQWPDKYYTIDLTNFPYYHKECGSTDNGSRTVYKNYGESGNPAKIDLYHTYPGTGTMYTTRDANLNYFYIDRWMNPINSPTSYGLTGVINPGDVNVILAGNLQLNGIGEHNMGNIYNIQLRDASVVADSRKFTAAANNHINDPDNKAATGVTAEEAFRHVMIRYEYDHHSYIVYVDDHAPAGDYEITYKLENKENNTQHGNVLFLTFKFKVALRDITVQHDKNTVNWQDDNKTLRVQHSRIHSSTDGHREFKSDLGYRVDLKQVFVLKDGTIDIVTKTLPPLSGANAGKAPIYRVKFEFIQDAGIKAAGFKYVRDADNYLTRIEFDGKLAAEIENDPANGFNYLYIKYSKEGDLLYNYLMSNMKTTMDMANHNTWTKWGKTELTDIDDMERLLPVRMVTDINGTCGWPQLPAGVNGFKYVDFDRFPNGNYYYIDDFNIKFERALRFAFTTVELTDDQQIQYAPFTFFTKYVDPDDESKSIYRGVFDHAYYGANPPAGHVDHGYGNLVYPGDWWAMPYTFINPNAQAEFYGLTTPPTMFIDMQNWHTLVLKANQLFIPFHPDFIPQIVEQYRGLDYSKVEISTTGGETWQKAPQDYSVLKHESRYFNVMMVRYLYGHQIVNLPVAIWQGDANHLTSPIYFRVPVYNQTAFDNDYAPEVIKPGKDPILGGYWMTFRAGHAKIKGYAVFKINPRKK